MATTFKRTQDVAKSQVKTALAIGATSIVLVDGSGFPAFAGNTYWVTIFGTTVDDGYEVCLVTGRTGDTLTVTRAQLGTVAQAWDPDDSVQMLIQAQHFDDITTAVNAIENGTMTHAALLVDADGLDVNPGSDIDADLITVGVTGTPKLIWDESEDKFDLNKGLNVSSGTITGSFGAIASTSLTVGNASNTKKLFVPFVAFIGPSLTYDESDGNGYVYNSGGAMAAFHGLILPGVGSIIESVIAYWESVVAGSTGSVGLFKFSKEAGTRTQVANLSQAFSAMTANGGGGYTQTLSSGGPWTVDTDMQWIIWCGTNNSDGRLKGLEILYRDRVY